MVLSLNLCVTSRRESPTSSVVTSHVNDMGLGELGQSSFWYRIAPPLITIPINYVLSSEQVLFQEKTAMLVWLLCRFVSSDRIFLSGCWTSIS